MCKRVESHGCERETIRRTDKSKQSKYTNGADRRIESWQGATGLGSARHQTTNLSANPGGHSWTVTPNGSPYHQPEGQGKAGRNKNERVGEEEVRRGGPL